MMHHFPQSIKKFPRLFCDFPDILALSYIFWITGHRERWKMTTGIQAAQPLPIYPCSSHATLMYGMTFLDRRKSQARLRCFKVPGLVILASNLLELSCGKLYRQTDEKTDRQTAPNAIPSPFTLWLSWKWKQLRTASINTVTEIC